MDRKELYEIIKKNDLQQSIKDEFGVNYTNVPSAQLEEFITENVAPSQQQVETSDLQKQVENKCSRVVTIDESDSYKAAFKVALNVLTKEERQELFDSFDD